MTWFITPSHLVPCRTCSNECIKSLYDTCAECRQKEREAVDGGRYVRKESFKQYLARREKERQKGFS